jgi:chloride channel 7
MEEASSFWSRKVAWRCFIAAVCAAFIMSSAVSDTKPGTGGGIITFENVYVLETYDWINQFPFMVLVAALGGLLGSMFNYLRRLLWKVRASRSRRVLRVIEALVTLVYCISVQFYAATYWGSCQKVSKSWPEEFKVRSVCVHFAFLMQRHAF